MHDPSSAREAVRHRRGSLARGPPAMTERHGACASSDLPSRPCSAIGVVLNFVVFLSDPALPGGGSIVNFFSFFTILVNLMLIAAMALPVLAPASVGGRLPRPAVDTGRAAALYRSSSALVYAIVLRQLWNPPAFMPSPTRSSTTPRRS